MDEQALLKTSIILALLMTPVTSFFLSLSSKEVHYLVLKGEVESLKKSDGVTFVRLKTTLPVVFFEEVEINSSKITIKGRLENYKGRLEFVGEKIAR